MMEYVCMYSESRYFISTASSLLEVKPYSRISWRKYYLPEEDPGKENNGYAVWQELCVSQPKCSEIYYNTYAATDQHNYHRQDYIRIERKFQEKTWDKRVVTSITGMYCLDAWLMHRGCTADSLHAIPQLNQ